MVVAIRSDHQGQGLERSLFESGGMSAPQRMTLLVQGMLMAVVVLAAGGLVVSCGSQTTTVEVPVQDLAVDADGRTVRATVTTNTCGEPHRLVVEETTSEVLVTALVRERSGDCNDIGVVHPMSATLAAPLGTRALRSAG